MASAGIHGSKPGALIKAPKLTPAWEPDPPGPLSTDTVPDRYLLPATYATPRPELVVGVCLGTAAAAPFILFALPVWGFFATFAAVLGGARIYSSYRLRQWRRGMTAAFEYLERGDYDSAEETFRDVALGQRDPILRSASADFGYLAIRRGDFPTALAIYSRAWRSPGISHEARSALSLNMSMCYAAIGELDAARSWFPEEYAPGTPSAAAVVLARLKRFDDVLELAMPDLEPWQETFVRHERRLLYLMHAFALSSIDEDRELVAAHAAVAQPAYEGEYDYLTGDWPELAAFLDDQVANAMDHL